MTPKAKGEIAEAAVLYALVDRGFRVLIPFSESRYDLALDWNRVFIRIQVKLGRVKNGVIIFNTSSYDGRPYHKEADYFGVFEPVSKMVYLVPVDEHNSNGSIRLTRPKSNQQKGIRYAVDFSLDKFLKE